MNGLSLASTTWDTEEIEAIQAVIATGDYSMGNYVAQFEREFADFFGSKFAVMFNSGSSANLGMLAALRYRNPQIVTPGSEIIVPAVSWSTTFFPVHQLGFRLKFVDIELDSLNINVEKVVDAINPNTSGILAVNLLGNPANLIALKKISDENDLILLEDNCESMGAKINESYSGTFGLAGTFSTFFSHHISTMEGGLAISDDANLYETMKSIRAHGWTRDLPKENSVYAKTGSSWEDLFRFVLPGYNLRPLEFEAAIGLVQLRKLPSFIENRRKNAEFFKETMRDVQGFSLQYENSHSSWFGFSLVMQDFMLGKRQLVLDALEKVGVQTRPIVAGNFTKNPVIKHLNHAPLEAYPIADLVHNEGFFIGNHHFDIRNSLELVCSVLSDISKEVRCA
jgi:CDP-6-deoxy-D-xylo-4-hexulose-3-dehydrase